MWETLGALFGGLYLITKLSSGRAKAKDTEDRIKRRKEADEEWLRQHTNKHVEDMLYEYVKNKENFDIIQRNVRAVLDTFPHWVNYPTPLDIDQAKKYSRNHTRANNMLIETRNVVVNIMLAKRGLVSASSATFGYDAYIGIEPMEQKTKEFVYWIESENNKNGNKVKLSLVKDCAIGRYIWLGSSADR